MQGILVYAYLIQLGTMSSHITLTCNSIIYKKLHWQLRALEITFTSAT